MVIQRNVMSCQGSATITVQTGHHQRPMCPNRLLGPCFIAYFPTSSPFLRAPRPTRPSDQFSFADTQSHSPTTLVYEPVTHTSHIGTSIPSMAKPVMPRHAPPRLLLLPMLPTVADIILWICYCFLTYPNDTLNIPCVFTAATRSRPPVKDCSPFPQTPPALHFIFCLRRTGPINRRVHKCADNAGHSQRNNKRTRPRSHSLEPPRMLL